MKNFNKEIYREFNKDLANLSNEQLVSHFLESQHEARIYGSTNSPVELLSMRWLRGRGLEIGAGRNPTPLYGNATIKYCDIDSEHSFGGSNSEVITSVDSKNFKDGFSKKFDYVVCSHVLEHVDSLIMGIDNLVSIVKKKGIVYLVLPGIEFLHDKNWIPYFEFDHHVEEYENPLLYSKVHDELYINAVVHYIENSSNEHATLTDEYKKAILNRSIPDNLRFMHHKHNYSLQDWLKILIDTQKFLENKFYIADVSYGHQRHDIHFILQTVE